LTDKKGKTVLENCPLLLREDRGFIIQLVVGHGPEDGEGAYLVLVWGFMPRLGPKADETWVMKRRLYCRRFLARPVRAFFFSEASTFGVWLRTLPAWARDP